MKYHVPIAAQSGYSLANGKTSSAYICLNMIRRHKTNVKKE